MTSTDYLSFWENFTESIAILLSRGLTDNETEKIVRTWSSFQAKLRRLSVENLQRVQTEAKTLRPYCKHQLTCRQNAIRGFLKSFLVAYIR